MQIIEDTLHLDDWASGKPQHPRFTEEENRSTYENPEEYKKKEPTPCKKPFGLYAIRRDKRNPEYWFDEVLLHAFDTEDHAIEYKNRILEGTTYVKNIGGKPYKFESSPRITKYDNILEKYPEMVVMPINHTKKC